MRQQLARLQSLQADVLAAPDQQISLTDPDARAKATSMRGSGVVGYNVQAAVDTEHHLIVTHDVTNVVLDRSMLSKMALMAKQAMGVDQIHVLADRGYFSGREILAWRIRRRRTLRAEGLHIRIEGCRAVSPRMTLSSTPRTTRIAVRLARA